MVLPISRVCAVGRGSVSNLLKTLSHFYFHSCDESLDIPINKGGLLIGLNTGKKELNLLAYGYRAGELVQNEPSLFQRSIGLMSRFYRSIDQTKVLGKIHKN